MKWMWIVMIKLMDLIEQSEKIKIDIPTDPFIDQFDTHIDS